MTQQSRRQAEQADQPQEQSQSTTYYAQTRIEHDGETKTQPGDTVSPADVGGQENFDYMVEQRAIGTTKPVFYEDVTVPGILSVEEREGDSMLKDEDTKDATSMEEVIQKAREKSGVGIRSVAAR